MGKNVIFPALKRFLIAECARPQTTVDEPSLELNGGITLCCTSINVTQDNIVFIQNLIVYPCQLAIHSDCSSFSTLL